MRLIVARVHGGSSPFMRREASYRVPLRLGDDVFDHGFVGPVKCDALVEVFHAFRHLVNFFAPEQVRACATSSLREAANGRELAQRVWKETGIPIEIISGAEEARTLLSTHAEAGLDPLRDYLYVDVGGGSTELTLFSAGKVVCTESFLVGGVRLLQGRVNPAEQERMRLWVEQLPRGIRMLDAIGAGGNISKIYDMVVGTPGEMLARRRIREVVEALEKIPLEERVRLHNLKPDRADVIVPAGHVYHQVLKWAGIKSMVVPKIGVGDGLLAQMFENRFGFPPPVLTAKGKVD